MKDFLFCYFKGLAFNLLQSQQVLLNPKISMVFILFPYDVLNIFLLENTSDKKLLNHPNFLKIEFSKTTVKPSKYTIKAFDGLFKFIK